MDDRFPSSLILEMPVKTRVRPMLGTLVLQKERTLLDSKLVQVSIVLWQFLQNLIFNSRIV